MPTISRTVSASSSTAGTIGGGCEHRFRLARPDGKSHPVLVCLFCQLVRR